MRADAGASAGCKAAPSIALSRADRWESMGQGGAAVGGDCATGDGERSESRAASAAAHVSAKRCHVVSVRGRGQRRCEMAAKDAVLVAARETARPLA